MQWFITHLKNMQRQVKRNSTIAKLYKNNYNIGGKVFLQPRILQKRIKTN